MDMDINTLKFYENGYFDQPHHFRKDDLIIINNIRQALNMPLVDDMLKEIVVVEKKEKVEEKKEEKKYDYEHDIYNKFLVKRENRKKHIKYGEFICDQLKGVGMTPVEPLATMGNNDGPLLCDVCNKPIVLEGGKFNNITADIGWRLNPVKGWKSWILGGLVVRLTINGTLRIYHGYPDREGHCCTIGMRGEEGNEKRFVSTKKENINRFDEFLLKEMKMEDEKERMKELNELLVLMFDFDPGEGVNYNERYAN